ncbi:MAG TPA: hypothetical protein DD490_28700 [Acidobacteria bacterium]|nr:hypothetical protein [Acidobacteriota bacterium]
MPSLWRSCVLTLLPLLVPSPAQAGLVPRLVRDIEPTSYAVGSSPRQLTSLRHGFAFTAFGNRELWTVDEREGGIQQSLRRAEIRQVWGSVYAAREDAGGWGFWIVDGWPFFGSTLFTPERVGRLGAVHGDPQGDGPVAFEADQGRGRGLWMPTFSPQPGIVEIARPLALDDGALARDWLSWWGTDGARSFFIARHPTRGTALWRTDGSPAGTFPLVAPAPGKTVPLRLAGFLRGRFLLTISGAAPELWWSDGTGRPLRPFTTIGPRRGGATIFEAKVIEGRAFLVADDGLHGRQLWTTDGTVAGTRRLTRFPADAQRSIGVPAIHVEGTWYFPADDGVHGRELWATDGSPEGTRLVSDLCPGACGSDPRDLTSQNATVPYGVDFTAAGPDGPRALFHSDGTAGGTVRLTPPGVTATTGIQRSGYFAAADEAFGEELWSSGGTPETTMMSFDLELATNGGSYPSPLGSVGDRLLFRTMAYGSDIGFRLWSSDGTAAGTFAVPGPRGPRMGISDDSTATRLGGRLLFTGQVRNAPPYSSALWATEGTESGIVRLTPPGVAVVDRPFTVGTQVLFFAQDADHGTRLWASEGTAETTRQVTGPETGASSIELSGSPMLLQGRLIFRRYDDFSNIWTADGGTEGIRRLSEVRPELAPLENENFPLRLAEIPGKLLFAARLPTSLNERLWVSDATQGGTFPLETPGTASVDGVFAAGSRAFFFVTLEEQPPGVDPHQLWVTDGTQAGTKKVEAPPLPEDGFWGFRGPTAFGQRLLFIDSTYHFWVTDGTSAGTFPLLTPDGQSIFTYSGSASAFGSHLIVSGNSSGCYAWDGTGATVEPLDVEGCDGFYPVGDRLFFSGFEPRTGRELWVLEEK